MALYNRRLGIIMVQLRELPIGGWNSIQFVAQGTMNPVVLSDFNVENFSVRFYDVQGRVCAEKLFDNNNNEVLNFDMSCAKPGIYLVQVIGGTNKYMERIVKL